MSNTPFSFPFEAQFDQDRSQEYVILSLLRGTINTAELVQVQAVNPVADRVGFVTVQPMVLDVDTNSIVLDQSPAYNVPYMRMQGGVSAIILDPVVGDIGVALYAQKDITTIKRTLQPSPASTDRVFSTADGLYLGGFLNGAPTQYVQFLASAAGINIVSPGNINLNATGNIALNAGGSLTLQAGSTIATTSASTTTVNASQLVVNAPTTFNNTISGTATGSGKFSFASPITVPDVIVPNGSVNNHIHGGVQTGSGNTGNMTG